MPKKTTFIPVNPMANEHGAGISIERISFANSQLLEGEAEHAHRHDGHAFFLLENGSITIEIDFQKYELKAPSVIYVHPDQVHRTTSADNVTVSSWAVINDNLNPEYGRLLEDITPAKPIPLQQETFRLISDAVSLSISFCERKNDRLHHSLLKDSCNALVALVASLYLEQAKPADKLTRFETVNKAFKHLVEENYAKLNRPADYAEKLNLSTSYLNECVKNTTGYSVSYHLQQRVILEAKRLLFHSDKSVKEIAAVLGYDDYPYFSRLFSKVTGMTALAFRNKNRE